MDRFNEFTGLETARCIELLILQTTPFCNINCSYCYLPNRHAPTRMPLATVTAACQRVQDAGLVGDHISVVWHAGEPLVVGPEYFQQLMNACWPLNRSTPAAQHYVQTNAMLINDRFCELFRKYNVRVGVSLDGPRDIHDRHRVNRGGDGTFDLVMRGVKKLRQFAIRFDVICVVTADSLRRPEELYDFFRGLADSGLETVGFSVEEIEGANQSSSMDYEGAFAALHEFWQTMFRLHFKRKAFRFREADDLLEGIRYGTLGSRSNLARPFAIVSVAVDGSVGTFSPELLGLKHRRYGDFVIGNVLSESIPQMTAGPSFQKMSKEIDAGVQRCLHECHYYPVCGGGAPSNKLAEHGTFDAAETKHCRATKIAVVNSLIEVAKDRRFC